MKKRFAIYKSGYVKEDSETIIEPKFVDSKETEIGARNLLDKYCKTNNVDKSDYHIVQEQKDIVQGVFIGGWATIEGTEIHF